MIQLAADTLLVFLLVAFGAGIAIGVRWGRESALGDWWDR